jgi:hypothetical protein
VFGNILNCKLFDGEECVGEARKRHFLFYICIVKNFSKKMVDFSQKSSFSLSFFGSITIVRTFEISQFKIKIASKKYFKLSTLNF